MTYNEMAKKLLKDAEANGRSSIEISKGNLAKLRIAICAMVCYSDLNITTRYDKEDSVINVFLI